jgi:hypothetical protein
MMYPSLLAPTSPLWARENSSYQYRVMTERHLQAIWLEQIYFRRLVTASGKCIEVISPGIWNFDAGPDFLKAHLRIGGRELRGDVEIHLSDENWTEHGHHLDARYNDVILHLSLWEPKKEICVRTLSGRQIEQTYFEKAFTISESVILQKIDLDLYPYKKFVGSGKCAHSLYKDLSKYKALQLFGEAAEWRLRQKLHYLERQIKTPEWQFVVGVAMALGYKRNTEAFLNLFLYLFNTGVRDEEQLLVLSLQACGFFSDRYQEKWKGSSYYKRLLEMAAAPIKHKAKLVLHQIRPLNHPLRRLVAMAKLLSNPSMPFLYSRLITFWELRWRRSMYYNTWWSFLAKMRRILPTFDDPYWNSHFTFESAKGKHIPMIGDSLKTEIIVNTFFPLLWAHIKKKDKNRAEVRAFFDFYMSIPSSNTSKTRYLTHRFYGDTPKGEILQNVFTEQGAYQLHKDFCIHYEASCEGCPFVDRYEITSKTLVHNKSSIPISSQYRRIRKHQDKRLKTRGPYLTMKRKKTERHHLNSKLILTLGRSSRKIQVHFQWG